MNPADFAFSFQVDGLIWRTVLDRDCFLLALEVRDREQMHLHYRILDFDTLELSAPFTIEGADWWTTLVTMSNQYLLLERYEDPQDPVSKQLMVYDAQKGECVKVLDDFQLLGLERDSIVGQSAREPEKKLTFSVERELKSAGQHHDLMTPVHFQESDSAFELVREYLEGVEPVLGCEYLEWKDFIIISYYLRSHKKFTRRLLILKEEEEIFHETQDKELDGYASGSFFIFKGYIVFVQEGNEIHGVKI